MGLKDAGAVQMFTGSGLFDGTRYLGLLVGSTEVSGSSYERRPVTVANVSVANGVATINVSGDFVDTSDGFTTEDWGNVNMWGLWTAATGGTQLHTDNIKNASDANVTLDINSGDSVEFATGAFTFDLNTD